MARVVLVLSWLGWLHGGKGERSSRVVLWRGVPFPLGGDFAGALLTVLPGRSRGGKRGAWWYVVR